MGGVATTTSMTTTTSTERAAPGRPPSREPLRAASEVPVTSARPGLVLSDVGLLRLLQLASSLCPIGAFAYSQGLETAVERGWVSSESTLADWVGGVGEHALAQLDLPLLALAHAAARAGDTPRLLAIGERLHASREARELSEQERQLGSSLASVLVNLGVEAAAPFRGHEHASYVVCFALGAHNFGVEVEAAMLGFAFAWCEQQVSAAARLGPLGHMAAQRALSAIAARVPGWVARASALDERDIGSVTPGLAMSAAWHETQYTRLFRS
jgi:urease accessory protein